MSPLLQISQELGRRYRDAQSPEVALAIREIQDYVKALYRENDTLRMVADDIRSWRDVHNGGNNHFLLLAGDSTSFACYMEGQGSDLVLTIADIMKEEDTVRSVIKAAMEAYDMGMFSGKK